MNMLWLVLFVALTGSHQGYGLPMRSTSQTYPHDSNGPAVYEGWWSEGGMYAAVPALALVIAAVGLLFGCTWCYRHKDCKPNGGADNQLFTASASHLHDVRRSQPPDSGFSEPVNNNISEDNNNGPISLREMQNIENNNAAVYIVSENEERNRVSRESVVEFEPLPSGIRVVDPLEHCADWFGGEDLPRNRLQYLREIGRGWFGRVVEGEIEGDGTNTTVAVKILNQNASLEDKARFLDEARLYRDARHENILPFITKCLQEDPWILIFELCSMDLQQYLIVNRPKMAILNEGGVPLQLMCDVASGLAYLHSRGYLYGNIWSGAVLVRGTEQVRALLGEYAPLQPAHDVAPPEARSNPNNHTTSSEVWSLGTLIWEVCAWGSIPLHHPLPLPDLPCPYRNHLYQVMQLCWNANPEARPTSSQVHALLNHLHMTHMHAAESSQDDGYGSSDFEERWQRLKPNTIPIIDEHVAIVHAPSTSMASHFTGSDQEFDNVQTVQDSLSIDMDTAVSRSSSIMSDKDTLSVQIKSESLTNLHGSLEDVRNIYLTHNETAALECHQGNISLEDSREKDNDRSDSSVDPWLKDIIAGSHDDVSYYKDVSDVIKNLDNMLNSEKTSSSESSHQASPSRDNLSLDCRSNYPMQSSMVKSPGISNFQNILERGFLSPDGEACEDDMDRETIGTLSHSYERHSDSASQHTLENLTPITPVKDSAPENEFENFTEVKEEINEPYSQYADLPKQDKIDYSASELPKLKDLCIKSMPSLSDIHVQQSIIIPNCQTTCDNNVGVTRTDDIKELTKSIDDIEHEKAETIIYASISNNEIITPELVQKSEIEDTKIKTVDNILPKDLNGVIARNNDLDLTLDVNTTVAVNEEERGKSTIQDFECNPPVKTPEVGKIFLDLESSKMVQENGSDILINRVQPIATECLSKKKYDVAVINPVINTRYILTRAEDNAISDLNHEKCFSNWKSFKENDVGFISHHIVADNSELIQPKNDDIILQNCNANKIEDKSPSLEFVPENLKGKECETIEGKNISDDTMTKKMEEEIRFLENTTQEYEINESEVNCHTSLSDHIIKDENQQHSKTLDVTITPTVIENNSTYDNDLLLSNKLEKELVSKECDIKIEPDKSDLFAIVDRQSPEIVQNVINLQTDDHSKVDFNGLNIKDKAENCEYLVPVLVKPATVQDNEERLEQTVIEKNINITGFGGDSVNLTAESVTKEQSSDSTSYMDLINDTNSKINNNIDNTVTDLVESCFETSNNDNIIYSLVKNESTVYLDLPSIIKETGDFLYSEREYSQKEDAGICASTPKGTADNTLENSKENEVDVLSHSKIPDNSSGINLTKLEQKCVPESMSPFDSPSKSHHTDTYDENSSVVLGPFENYNLESFKVVKSSGDLVELPKEELLAFSSNFSEINLETPSPLRDGNFLNEVPDIMNDERHLDDAEISEANKKSETPNSTEEQSTIEKRLSPSTPPNSPGIFLASTSQQKYLVDIDLNDRNETAPEVNLQDEIDLNQIELQITTKLAMAENENNMNIEYSGPLTVEGLEHELSSGESDALPESYLAGNGGSIELRDTEGLTLNEECMKALRNELELKLPLAQVATIEPHQEGEWSTELPPPPELIVNYPGALSPIVEETRQQLSAYENDLNWNASIRTDSSESYPEPCNNSTDEVTDLLTGVQSGFQAETYTVHSNDHSVNDTYTIHKDITSSKELTMSADSLNTSPHKMPLIDTTSPIDDKTYVKNDDEKDSKCERISQVSPFLTSPTTDTSAPDTSDVGDNATGISTLSKTTVPTDAKSSKPSETQCLSKATSIDSWCSNDTLYNVEENFDDLAMDPDVPMDFVEHDKSVSSDTLTHNDDEKDLSHCSTYIVHDSKSEIAESFSPDSITANDNYTYTKVKTDAVTTPSATKSEMNDSTKNTQTKDLAYETLLSGLPSYSNCTTEVISSKDNLWNLPQPELVRRSPIGDDIELTPPKHAENKECSVDSPQLKSEPCINKMDSVDITCLKDNIVEHDNSEENAISQGSEIDITNTNSPDFHYKNMAQSATSTPLIDLGPSSENVEVITIQLPSMLMSDLPNFQSFQQSVEIRPQDISSNANECVSTSEDTGILLKGETTHMSMRSTKDSLGVCENTPSYSDFESSAVTKPQDVISRDGSSQSTESGMSTEFRHFESSLRNRPQDLSALMDASSLLLFNERKSSEMLMSVPMDFEFHSASQSESRVSGNDSMQSLDIIPPNVTNLVESHNIFNINDQVSSFIADYDLEEETEQPHSIIITEVPKDTFDSHNGEDLTDLMRTFDSHIENQANEDISKHSTKVEVDTPILNGITVANDIFLTDIENVKTNVPPEDLERNNQVEKFSEILLLPQNVKEISDGCVSESQNDGEDSNCNGSEKFATVNFINENFEELIESNVDDDTKDTKPSLETKQKTSQEKSEEKNSENIITSTIEKVAEVEEKLSIEEVKENIEAADMNGIVEKDENKITSVTDNFLQNEKQFCQLDSYLPLLSDIRFTGPAEEIMSTSFTQDSPTEPTSPECEQNSKPDAAAEILKEWDSDSDSHSSNSSSGEFIWKDGDGHVTSVVPSTHFDHQRDNGQAEGCDGDRAGDGGAPSEGSGDSASGSEGDEVEFVPSSWDCRAAPAKSSLRSLEQATPDNKKRVVFKRQKYHCVYEYPREVADIDTESPGGYLPDFSTYSEWDPASVDDAELGYGQLFGGPNPLDLYPLRAGISFGADYDDDFYISSSARPFESLGIMSTTSQFFPGMHVKSSLLERDLSDEVSEDFPPPPSPLPTATLVQTRTPSLDFTTPDSGVEDITPGSTLDEDFKKKIPESEIQAWRPVDSGSSSESVSPSSPGGEALGGLRHTRDKLKLDLPPSPHLPSPRHNRVFNFVLDKPKRRVQDERAVETGTTPLVMSDETPNVTTSLPLQKDCEDVAVPEPTFSTFGKSVQKTADPEQKGMILTDDAQVSESSEVKEESHVKVEPVKGEGTVLDSGDEDSGIESSSKATLERNKTPNVS